MRVFVDTNGLVDFVCRREPFGMAAKAFVTMFAVMKMARMLSSLSMSPKVKE